MGLGRYLIRSLVRSAERRSYRMLTNKSNTNRNYSAVSEIENLVDLYNLTPQFNENGWEEAYTEVIDSMVEYAGNAGQETLLTEYFPLPAKRYCAEAEQDYTPEAFVQYVKIDLGDNYYNAISFIIDECSQILYEVWDQNYQNDNFLEVFFGGLDRYTPGRTYSSMREAGMAYENARLRNGYRPNTTAENQRYNLEKNRTYLRTKFGSGKIRSWKSNIDGLELTTGYSAYQSAASARGYKNNNTRAGSEYNFSKNKQELRTRFGTGKIQAWKP